MKKNTFIIIFLAISSVYAQTGDKQIIESLNQKALQFFKNQNYDEALKYAQQAVELSVKSYGFRAEETAGSYTSLGAVYQGKRKLDKSIENLQRAVEIYRNIPDLKSEGVIAAYQILAYSQFLDGKEKDAEASYLKAVESAESMFGKDSKQGFYSALTLANFYARNKEFEKADEYYLKGFAAAAKVFGKDSAEKEKIEESRICLVSTQKFDRRRDEIFNEAKKKLLEEYSDAGEIMNGKAISLPKPLPIPAYIPQHARQQFRQTVYVRVKIDKQGNVVEVKPLCGESILSTLSEDAARKAKFTPTLIDGKPTEVSGYIVYNFVP